MIKLYITFTTNCHIEMNEAAMLFPVVCFGEVNWHYLPGISHAGGPALALAYHLRKLGIQPAVITRAGLDGSGKKLVELLEAWNISTDFFQLDGKLPTGKVTAKFNESNELSYEIAGPAAWDHITADEASAQLVACCSFFVYGSLATRNTLSRNSLYELLEIAPFSIFDLNLRNAYYSRDTIEYILGRTDLLKLNLAELELITGWFSIYASTDDTRSTVAGKI